MVPKPNISGVTPRGLLPALFAWLMALSGPLGAQNDRSSPPPGAVRAVVGAPTEPVVIDDFSDASRWQVVASDGVEGRVSTVRVTGPDGSEVPALRMDFDFKRGSGYCIVRRELDLAMPVNYRVGFGLMGSSGVLGADGEQRGFINDLEFKLYDQTGDNVWWVRTPDYRYEPVWSRLRYVRRQLDFAWGPGGGKVPLERVRAIEFAVTSSAAGAASGNAGKGHILLTDLRLEPMGTATGAPGSAGVLVNGAEVGRMVDGAVRGVALSGERGTATLTLDFGGPAEFGGLMLAWDGAGCRVIGAETSVDGVRQEPWSLAETPDQGRVAFFPFGGGEAREVRVRFSVAEGMKPVLGSIVLLPRDAASNPNRIIQMLAKSSQRGWYPRQFLDEQVSWAVFGLPGEEAEGLLGSEGQVEVGKLGMTIEPMLETEAGVETWADWATDPSLPDGRTPLPRIDLRGQAVGTLRVEPMVHGNAVAARYTLTNDSSESVTGTLHLLLRAFQVLPYWHTLNVRGGTAPVESSASARAERGTLSIGGFTMTTTGSGVSVHLGGINASEIGALVGAGELGAGVSGPVGSGALGVPFRLGAGESVQFWVVAAKGDALPAPAAADLDAEYAKQSADWAARLRRVTFALPTIARDIEDTFYAQLGWILVNRDGPAIQPGSRTYDRTWIRDGALTATALLYTGHAEEVREFLDWFRQFQYDNGKVPCCADERGPDPVPEHDSHGQYVYGVATYHRFTRDVEFLRRHWPNVQKAVEYIEFLRAQRMTPEYAQADGLKRAMYGLVPESISHEGYSAKPMHSYWDDLFTLRGLKDAAYIAEKLGERDVAAKYVTLRDEFAASLVDSVQRATAFHKIDYVPGCVELGDFDATSTAVAVFPCDAAELLPRNLLERTFDKAWENFVARRDGQRPWNDYTPYENRMISAMLMLGHPDRAHAMLDWYMKDQNPPGWRQWSEIVWRDKAAPRFVGDTPHTWVGSDFLKAIRNLCVYERESDGALVVGAGLPLEWLRAPREDGSIGVKVADFPTKYGLISFTASAGETEVTIEVSGGANPPGGVIVAPWGMEPVRAGSLPAAVKVAIPR